MKTKKQKIDLKEPVRIRMRKLKFGNASLYLDIYYKGMRKKEYLSLYIIREVNDETRLRNENTWEIAEQMKAERILSLHKHGIGGTANPHTATITLLEWNVICADDGSAVSEATHNARLNANTRLEQYLELTHNKELLLRDADKDFCTEYVAFLKTCTYNQGKKRLSSTTCRIYCNVLSQNFEKALRKGMIERNPYKLLGVKERPRRANVTRDYLTIEELKKLMKTPCRYEIVKKAFLFCCFTGLRYSDMLSLKWSEIHTAPDDKTLYIEHQQVKTQKNVTIPLSAEAIKWLPEKKESEDKVFHECTITNTTLQTLLCEWMRAARIKKHITFHCSRHTAATLYLTLGANLYVVSKILGHSSIKMTEVYAKIVDKNKIDTVNLVNDIFK